MEGKTIYSMVFLVYWLIPNEMYLGILTIIVSKLHGGWFQFWCCFF